MLLISPISPQKSPFTQLDFDAVARGITLASNISGDFPLLRFQILDRIWLHLLWCSEGFYDPDICLSIPAMSLCCFGEEPRLNRNGQGQSDTFG